MRHDIANSFYVHIGQKLGRPYHQGHPKVEASSIPISPSLLPEEEKETMGHFAASCCGSGVGRNYLFSKLGKYMLTASVRNHSKIIHNGQPEEGKTQQEQLIDYFLKTEDVSFQVLWDVPTSHLMNDDNKE